MDIGTKKALGIVTCLRPEFYEQILDTTPFNDVDCVYVFDSSPEGSKYAKNTDSIKVIPHEGSATVGVAKNRLMKAMVEDGHDHIFLQEGDVGITDGNVFDLYINTAKQSGIWGSLNFAHHGTANKDISGIPVIKNSIDLDEGVGIDFTHHGSAAFSYIHKNIIKHMGYHDEFYQNCWEHLDYYQTQTQSRLASYWWWFTDAKNSVDYIREFDGGDCSGSVIRRDQEWRRNMQDGAGHFRDKFGYHPTMMPEATEGQVLERMEFLMDNYSI